MQLVALEEHLVTREILDAWRRLPPDRHDPSLDLYSKGETLARLEDVADRRLRDMDESGVDVQVLSLVSPGLEALQASEAVAFAREINEVIAATVRRRPDRFEGFAALPTAAPADAAKELERAVTELGLLGAMLNGRTGDHNLDEAGLEPVFAAAAALRCPLYIHPQTPSAAVRAAYYSGFGDPLDTAFATGGIGWHYETGMQVLRLIMSGVFDRHPDLQIIIGHWGEAVLFYLERVASLQAQAPWLKRSIPDYFRQNISVTPSGIFSQRYLRWAVEVLGVERILFSTDYPFQFAPAGGARAFLAAANLSTVDRERIADGNWRALTGGLRGSEPNRAPPVEQASARGEMNDQAFVGATPSSERSSPITQTGAGLFALWGILHLWVGFEGLHQYVVSPDRGLWSMFLGGRNAPAASFSFPVDPVTANAQAHIILNFCFDVAGYGLLGLVVAWLIYRHSSWTAYLMGAVLIGICDLSFLFLQVTSGIITPSLPSVSGPILWLIAVSVTPFGLVPTRRR